MHSVHSGASHSSRTETETEDHHSAGDLGRSAVTSDSDFAPVTHSAPARQRISSRRSREALSSPATDAAESQFGPDGEPLYKASMSEGVDALPVDTAATSTEAASVEAASVEAVSAETASAEAAGVNGEADSIFESTV